MLDRLVALKEVPAHEKVLQELVMDILRVLAAPDLEVRKKTLNLALELVNSRSIEEVREIFFFIESISCHVLLRRDMSIRT